MKQNPGISEEISIKAIRRRKTKKEGKTKGISEKILIIGLSEEAKQKKTKKSESDNTYLFRLSEEAKQKRKLLIFTVPSERTVYIILTGAGFV